MSRGDESIDMQREYTASVRALQQSLRAMRSPGAREALLARIGISSDVATQLDERVPAYTVPLALGLAARAAGDPHWALRVAERTDPARLDLIAHLASHSSTLREGIERVARAMRLFNEGMELSLEVRPRRASLVFTLRGLLPDQDEEGVRQLLEMSTATFTRVLREQVGLADLARVSFTTTAPDGTASLRRFYGAPLRFEQPRTEVVFDAAWLARPIRTADAALGQVLERYASELLARLPRPYESATEQVRAHLVQRLGSSASLTATARALGVGPRTLQRRLKSEGTTFARIWDELRSGFARRQLADPSCSIAEIGAQLGFEDLASFYRAFRRWTGETPLELRRGMSRSANRVSRGAKDP